MNYFLGMTFCKLFAAKLLNTPWLLHLDVFRPTLNPVLSGRSRPDLVGLERGGAPSNARGGAARRMRPRKTRRKPKPSASSA